MIPNGLSELMNRNGILVVVIASVGSGQKVVIGNRMSLESDYAVRVWFDDLTVERINRSLEGRILPQMVQQGKVCGVICKPTEDVVVGLYYHDERDVFHRYRMSKTLDAEVRALWS